MSAKEILHSIAENDYASANEKVQRELQVRAYQKVQEMKPSIMKKRFGESFEDARDESVQLDEELKLGNRDNKVITAFTNQEADESKKLKSTGKRLDIMGMDGTSVAYWKNGNVMLTDLGSKAAQTVQNKIKKEMPSNKVFHE